ncbi:MAG: hypothetical protein M1837_002334 [Sclerophora amabilis]|nr:MAG: hypothetical protein M1837_002334 [Sclerophora amabilis]
MASISTTSTAYSTTLIVGGGIFGTSTAYHLALAGGSGGNGTGEGGHRNGSDGDGTGTGTGRGCGITVLDRAPSPSPQAASTDYNKIVRADYGVPFYMELGYEAMEAWANWDIFRGGGEEQRLDEGAEEGETARTDVYHQTGWVMLDDEKESDHLAARIRRNFRDSGRKDPTSDIGLVEARHMWGGVFRNSDFSKITSAYYNPEAGWADAADAVQRMMSDAVRRGVRYEVGDVVEILLAEGDDRSTVRGVRCRDGREFTADKVLLATGAWTSKLMAGIEDRLNLEEKDSIEEQATAAGVCVAHFVLNDVELERVKDMPVVIHGQNGDIQPPTKDRIFKFTNSATFTNTVQLANGRHLSVPPDQEQNNIPSKLKEETIEIIRREMPEMLENGRRPDIWRLCCTLVLLWTFQKARLDTGREGFMAQTAAHDADEHDAHEEDDEYDEDEDDDDAVDVPK